MFKDIKLKLGNKNPILLRSLGGPEGVYHQKSSDMSILGFSIVGISKMMSIFILGYPQPPQGRPGGELGGPEGVYHQKSSVMSILGFLLVGISKMISIFILGYPQPPKGTPRGGLGGARGGIPPKIKWYVNFGVFNSGDFKNDIYFHFRLPPTPKRVPPGGGLGGPDGVYLQKSSVMSILGFSLVGISKMISIFILGSPQPPQGRLKGALGGGLGGP